MLMVTAEVEGSKVTRHTHVDYSDYTPDEKAFLLSLCGRPGFFNPLDRHGKPMVLSSSQKRQVLKYFRQVEVEREHNPEVPEDLEALLELSPEKLLQESDLPLGVKHLYRKDVREKLSLIEQRVLEALLLVLRPKDQQHRKWIQKHGSEDLKTQVQQLPEGTLFIDVDQDLEGMDAVFEDRWAVKDSLFDQFLQETLALEHPGWFFVHFADTVPLRNPPAALKSVARKNKAKVETLLNLDEVLLPAHLKKRFKNRKTIPTVAVWWRNGHRVYLDVPQEIPAIPTRKAKPGEKQAYQLRIRLLGVSPSIWRSFQVAADIRFSELHRVIQTVMGWEDVHLHDFIARRGKHSDTTGHPEVDTLGELQLERGDEFYYRYDFGDLWEHVIKVEKVFALDETQPLPLCLKGQGACPEEDCGGPDAFMWHLKHSRKKKRLFSLEEVNRQLARLNHD